jgi:hypothetical protein
MPQSTLHAYVKRLSFLLPPPAPRPLLPVRPANTCGDAVSGEQPMRFEILDFGQSDPQRSAVNHAANDWFRVICRLSDTRERGFSHADELFGGLSTAGLRSNPRIIRQERHQTRQKRGLSLSARLFSRVHAPRDLCQRWRCPKSKKSVQAFFAWI